MVALMNSCGNVQQRDFWWAYLADYDGRPGSIIVNLALKERAPVADYQRLIVTGVNYASPDTNGLPSSSELDFLNVLAEKRLKIINQLTPSMFAGAFTHNGELLDYIYVRDTKGVEEVLKKFYQDSCPDRKQYINLKEDSKWEAYFEFLFPNAQTIEFHRQELTQIGYLKK
jgi:uncharacterized protein (TIGR01619 family)